jgi:anti-sigma regulatory factor (Ser/Thr protein kinase)
VANAQYDAVVASVPLARQFISELLDRWEMVDLKEIAMLLASELVTNVLVHASTELALVVAVADGSLEVGVTDLDPHSTPSVLPKLQQIQTALKDEVLAEGGRGLALVDLLSNEWGVVGFPHGKQVWFRLNASSWSYHSTCPCHSNELDRVRLESGHFAVAVAGPWDIPRVGR